MTTRLGSVQNLSRSRASWWQPPNFTAGYWRGGDRAGSLNQPSSPCESWGGSAARQHLILLLAARHFPADRFDRLTREIENLFFAYVITREPTRDFERDFARWATEVRAVNTDEELDALIDKRF